MGAHVLSGEVHIVAREIVERVHNQYNAVFCHLHRCRLSIDDALQLNTRVVWTQCARV